MAEHPVEWRISNQVVAYPDALAAMEERVEAIRAGLAPELCWLLEHPPLYTAGTSARAEDLLAPTRFPVFPAGRGAADRVSGRRLVGQGHDRCTGRRGPDLRAYIWGLEEWVIRTLEHFNLHGKRRQGRVGIWLTRPDGAEAKIAAIGVRIRRWVTYHGIAINLDPDLDHFTGIVPCGIKGFGVTSFADLGLTTSMAELDSALIDSFAAVFGGAP
jgi:lipoyl(octanoyl) transferase